MKHDLATAWARLKGSLYNPNKRCKPGTCMVLIDDLEKLLVEVEALSNAQMAKYLTKITLEELRNDSTAAEAPRHVERGPRRNRVVRHAHRAAADCGVAESVSAQNCAV